MIESINEKIVSYINITLLALIAFSIVFPVLYVISVSLTPLAEVYRQSGFPVIPRQITFEAYSYILSRDLIPRAFLNSLIITLSGLSISLVLSTLMAYPLSKKRLPGRTFLLLLVLIPLLFSGGLIPLFILVKNLNLLNTYWAVVLPSAVWSYNVLVMKSFFETIPDELLEAAHIDGASEWTILLRIVLPLSKPVLATIGLFYAVSYWNNFFFAQMFITNPAYQPMQVVLRNILIDAIQSRPEITEGRSSMPGETLKMATVVISFLPMLLVYPFLQKYFTKGLLLGSIKG
jgi:putative aldouronate transport system permease protein